MEIGFVASVKSYLLSIEGLPSARPDDIVVGENGGRALVIASRGNRVKAMSLGHATPRIGERYALEGPVPVFSFGDHLFGRTITALGKPIDGGAGMPEPRTLLELDIEAEAMGSRRQITDQFESGITLIDTLLPLAKGQRQLLFGPIHSGKTLFLLDLIANQRGRDVVCIYTAVGKPAQFLNHLTSRIHSAQGNPRTIIVAALSDEPSPLIAIAPSVGMSIAEHFRKLGRDVLLVIDDLAMHAKYLREIALLEGRLPGRESYPGDVFYQQARVIERAGNFNERGGGGSITLLPVLETEIENYTDLIPTNLMSATDGHYLFSSTLSAEGAYPSIPEDQSVTRVGRNSQKLAQKQLAFEVLSLLANYRREQEYIQFGAPFSERTARIIKNGKIIYSVLRQNPFENISAPAQVAVLALVFLDDYLQTKEPIFLKLNKKKLIDAFDRMPEFSDLRGGIEENAPFAEILDILKTKTKTIDALCQS